MQKITPWKTFYVFGRRNRNAARHFVAKNMRISNVIGTISASTCMSNMTFDIHLIMFALLAEQAYASHLLSSECRHNALLTILLYLDNGKTTLMK
jgi:hypothetical protein